MARAQHAVPPSFAARARTVTGKAACQSMLHQQPGERIRGHLHLADQFFQRAFE